MYWSQYRLERAKKITFADTTTIDLPESGLLSAIICHVRGKNASAIQGAKLPRLIDHLTKIEITDGGTRTMQSLTGYEQKANNFYRMGAVPPEQAILYGNKSQWTSFAILFGRKPYDPKYMFDLAQWDDVDLEITNDITTSFFQANEVNIDIDLILAKEMAAVPAEYIKSYEWKKEVADKDTDWINVKIPTRDMIRRLMFMPEPHLDENGGAVADPFSDSYTFQLTFKEYSEQVYDHRPKDMERNNVAQFGVPRTSLRGLPSTTIRLDTQLGYVHSAQVSHTGDSAVTAGIESLEDENGRFQKFRTLPTGGDIMDLKTSGMGYMHTFVVPFDLEDDPALFLNPAKGAKGPVHVKWYAHKDDHNFRTILEVNKKQGEV